MATKSSTSKKSSVKKTEKETAARPRKSTASSKSSASKKSSASAKNASSETSSRSSRASSSRKRKSKQSKLIRYEIELVLLFAFTVLSTLSLHSSSMGVAGEFTKTVYLGLFASTAYIVPYFITAFIFLAINKNLKAVRSRYMLAFGAAFLAILLLFTVGSMEIISELLEFNSQSLLSVSGIQLTYKNGIAMQGGGVIGTMITYLFTKFLGTMGTYVIIFVLFVIALVLGTRMSIIAIWEKQKAAVEKLSAIEVNLPEVSMPKLNSKPKSVKDARKQMKQLKKSTASTVTAKPESAVRAEVSPVPSAEAVREDAAGHIVRESLKSKVRDFSSFDSEHQLDDHQNTEKTLPGHSVDEEVEAHTNVIGSLIPAESNEDEKSAAEGDKSGSDAADTPNTGIRIVNALHEDDMDQPDSEDMDSDEIDSADGAKAVSEHETTVHRPAAVDGQRTPSGGAQTEASAQSQAKDGAVQKLKDSDIDSETKTAVESSIKKSVKAEYANYKLPPFKILNKVKSQASGKNNQEVIEKAHKLEETLNHFGVEAKVVQISKGPTITMFELEPKPGTKVSKITNLSDDIALSLAAHQVRIVAPIPGKAAVGVEIPNENKSMVGLRDVIDTEAFKTAKSKLTFALGKDISGKPIISNLAKMPHMLIAGATGSGKSVCVNALISSILFNAKPDEVKFLMIDPKVVELSTYNGIPHLILPVVTDPKKAAVALNWAVQEMTRRYQLFADTGVKDSDSYNRKAEEHNANLTEEDQPREKLAKIVVIIDELADLMMVAPDQVEDAICRLAQMARAAGIHLIVATQRPSVDVITGIIKANIPSRIAFSVSSQTDSRTILDMAGAEKLLGQGDMLYYPTGQSKPKRIQGAFISDEEVEALVDTIKNQVDDVDYDEEILETTIQTQAMEDADEYLPEAIELVVHTGQASASMLQRKFRVGYNRAARLVDSMEERGIIGPSRGSKPREVLISKEELEELNIT